MTPASKASAAHQVEAARLYDSWAFAEQFVPLSEPGEQARRSALQLGIEPITAGGVAALTFLTRLTAARAAVEIGTGGGGSGLAILTGMLPDGVLTSIDAEPEHQQTAREVFTAAGIAPRRARLIAGAALTVLPKLSDGAYDLVFVDGDPLETVEYIAQAARLLRSGGVLVVNHAFAGGGLTDPANEADHTVIVREALESVQMMDEFDPLLLPVGDGLLVAYRV